MSDRELRYLAHLLDRINKNPRVEDMDEAIEIVDEVLEREEVEA